MIKDHKLVIYLLGSILYLGVDTNYLYDLLRIIEVR